MDRRTLLSVTLLASMAGPIHASDAAIPATGHPERHDRLERLAEARQGPDHTDRSVQVFRVGPSGALDLSNISGDVRITGGDGTEIRVEATRRVRHRDAAEARRLLDELRIDATQVGDRVEVRTVYPRRSSTRNGRGTSATVDYVVSVPRGAAVAVKTISGDLAVTSVSGEVRAESVSGDVEVNATPNLAVAKTVSGDVTARNAGGRGTVSLGTVSGTVWATELTARSLDCGSVSGDIQLTGVAVERLQAKSVSGNIEFGANLTRGGRYEFGSHSGDVRVAVGTDTGFEIDASTFSGSVRSDLPVTIRQTGERRGSTRTIRGTYGDAGAILAIKTFSGTVVITRR